MKYVQVTPRSKMTTMNTSGAKFNIGMYDEISDYI